MKMEGIALDNFRSKQDGISGRIVEFDLQVCGVGESNQYRIQKQQD
jgi:hypothetical protein